MSQDKQDGKTVVVALTGNGTDIIKTDEVVRKNRLPEKYRRQPGEKKPAQDDAGF